MRYCMMVMTLGMLALLLATTGCAKKSAQPNTEKRAPTVGSSSITKGTCKVCGKQSDTAIAFQVPYSTKEIVCSPECAQKLMADPKKYGVTPGTPPAAGGAAASSAPPPK